MTKAARVCDLKETEKEEGGTRERERDEKAQKTPALY